MVSTYWLNRCQGFDVYELDGPRIGRVRWLEYGSRADLPDALIVGGRLRGGRLVRVPVDVIAEIDAIERSILLQPRAPEPA